LSREAIGLIAGPGAAVDRDELEPALQERGGRRTRHRLVRPDGVHEVIEHGPLHALRIRIDVNSGLRASDKQLSHVNTDFDARHWARALPGTRRPLVNRKGGVGGAPRRIVDGVDPERGKNRRRRQLFDASAERLQLVDHDVERTARDRPGVDPVRLDEGG
jgi:hypothetical protein